MCTYEEFQSIFHLNLLILMSAIPLATSSLKAFNRPTSPAVRHSKKSNKRKKILEHVLIYISSNIPLINVKTPSSTSSIEMNFLILSTVQNPISSPLMKRKSAISCLFIFTNPFTTIAGSPISLELPSVLKTIKHRSPFF